MNFEMKSGSDKAKSNKAADANDYRERFMESRLKQIYTPEFKAFILKAIQYKTSKEIYGNLLESARNSRINERNQRIKCAYGAGDPTVLRVQASLVMAGYDLGNYGANGVDGALGSLTIKAIKEFKKTVGLECNEKLDGETMYALDFVTEKGFTKSEIELIGKEARDSLRQKSLSDIKGNGEWIPSNVMQLDGLSSAEKKLKQYFENKRIKWEQSKIDALWQATNEIDNKYRIQIDPRFLLAIIIQEGTGSFNTSSVNLAADGQHGIETNYALDLMKANDLIFGKILGYIYYGAQFRETVAKNNHLAGIKGSGDIFQYANWDTPIVRLNKKRIEPGVYAGHGLWCDGVRKIYNDLTEGSANSYEQYIANIDKSIVEEIMKAEGIKIAAYNFVALQNAQDYLGNLNQQWTVSVEYKNK